MRQSYCRLSFHRYGASQLDSFSNRVKNGIYTNVTTFATPTIVAADFNSVLTNFLTAAADYAQYGITKKTTYTTARFDLIEALDRLAVYVNTIANGDVSTIALAGYEPSREMAQRSQPLPKIESFTAKRSDTTGQIVVNIPALVNYGIVNYGCLCSEGEPLANFLMINGQIKITPTDPLIYQDVNKTRRKIFSGLTPGTLYYFYVFAVNAVSVSPVSDVKQVMAA